MNVHRKKPSAGTQTQSLFQAHQEDAPWLPAATILILRAGERDSLSWWDDESLTEAGRFALGRIFPRRAGRAALRLALNAARARHAGVLAAAGIEAPVTIFELVPNLIQQSEHADHPWSAPITDPQDFRTRLRSLVPGLDQVAVPSLSLTGLLDMTAALPNLRPSLAERATILAAGYLQGGAKAAVFPFLRPFSGASAR